MIAGHTRLLRRLCDQHHKFCEGVSATRGRDRQTARTAVSLFAIKRSEVKEVRLSSLLSVTSIPAVVCVILLPLQLRTHHIGQAPGPAGGSPDLPIARHTHVQISLRTHVQICGSKITQINFSLKHVLL